jgi:secondary thiamine-phosphate synthase enzyme
LNVSLFIFIFVLKKNATMIQQTEFTLEARSRGFHLITGEVLRRLPQPLPDTGMLHLFIKHTSCALSINENADSDVRRDMEQIMSRLVKENEPYYLHTLEGSDDMPAHAKCSLIGSDLTIPITRGRLNLGTWQGIYLCEFRDYGGARKVVATVMG